MPKNHHEIMNQNEEEKQPMDNQKFTLIKKSMNKPLIKGNITSTSKYKNNQIIENIKDNSNIKTNPFRKESYQNNNNINNNLEQNINIDNNIDNENFIDSETYIIDDNEPIEKPPNAVEINDLLGEKCDLDLDILSINFTNFEPSKTSSKTMGVIKAYGANTYQGLVRNYNEDRVSIIINMARPKNYKKNYWPKTSFFGIYDGHGGNMCSEFLRDCLHKLILNDINFPENVELAIKNGFLNAEQTFLNEIALDQNDSNIISDRSGSCAVVVIVVDKKIYVANVGDSRALFSEQNGKNFVVVTEDHKPNNEKEKKRIIKSGGHVYQSRTVISGAENENLNGQILFGPYRVLPGRLSVSRTIGDIEAKSPKFGGNPNVIIWEPDIFIFDLNEYDIDFFIMGCDGIFDQMSNEEIMDCAWMILSNSNNYNNDNEESFEYNFEKANIHEKCGLIVDFIIKSSMVRKSFDNVTCLMIAMKDFVPNEKNENKLNSISTEEYLKNIYRLNNSVNNQINSQIKKSINNVNNVREKTEVIKHKEQNISENNNNNVYKSTIIPDMNNKIMNKNNNHIAKENSKNLVKANLKLTNFINSKNNNLTNNMDDSNPKTYRNTVSSIIIKKNYNTNSNINNNNNNNVYIKKRKERNPRQKSTNKTDINNVADENTNNSNIISKKLINKIDTNGTRRIASNNIRMQSMSNNLQVKKKKINLNNNKLDGSQSHNDLSNHVHITNRQNKENSFNNNLIQKLKQNKINKMSLELNNKLVNTNNNSNNNNNNNNNSLNVHFYYSNTYSNKYKKLPYLKTNSISNISNLGSNNNNHLTTTNATLNSINSQMRPKKIKNLTKPKTFRYNNTSLNKYRKTFYKNKFFGNGNKTNYNNNTHNVNNISENNLNNNIIYSQNFNVKIKSKKSRETMTSRKKKYSFHKLIKSLGMSVENGAKGKSKQFSSKKMSYSKEKDIKNFLYKNKTNIISEQKEKNGNKKYTKKNTFKANNK